MFSAGSFDLPSSRPSICSSASRHLSRSASRVMRLPLAMARLSSSISTLQPIKIIKCSASNGSNFSSQLGSGVVGLVELDDGVAGRVHEQMLSHLQFLLWLTLRIAISVVLNSLFISFLLFCVQPCGDTMKPCSSPPSPTASSPSASCPYSPTGDAQT